MSAFAGVALARLHRINSHAANGLAILQCGMPYFFSTRLAIIFLRFQSVACHPKKTEFHLSARRF
jgi:hypothetical protein